MPPKRKKAQPPRLEVQKYKLLRQPMNLIGTQVKFLGSFWEGRMTAEEKATEYLCTVLDWSTCARCLTFRSLNFGHYSLHSARETIARS